MASSMKVPSIHGYSFHPWMADIHEWNATRAQMPSIDRDRLAYLLPAAQCPTPYARTFTLSNKICAEIRVLSLIWYMVSIAILAISHSVGFRKAFCTLACFHGQATVCEFDPISYTQLFICGSQCVSIPILLQSILSPAFDLCDRPVRLVDSRWPPGLTYLITTNWMRIRGANL